MDALPRLLADKNEQLLGLLQEHESSVQNIQRELINEFSVDERSHDTRYIFRLLRKYKFDEARALSALRDILGKPPVANTDPTHPLLDVVRSVSTHLVCIVALADAPRAIEDLKHDIVSALEHLRGELALRPVDRGIQFILVLDVQDSSVSASLVYELVPWYTREMHPLHPGMCAAVLVSGYSWTHAGVWGIVRRLLPASAATRVLFPKPDELDAYLQSVRPPRAEVRTTALQRLDMRALSTGPSTPVSPLAPRSSANPIFGYRAGGRKRKRDLARTLAALWFARWHKRLAAWTGFSVIWFMLLLVRRWRVSI
ncbi:hypothetical protein BKA62DRAFT_772381 [Auriculariales sp. MPI-PUGE-AT-0066]|nr:hypothetical protein BKA62DRAFT_772381 [Auriculariales sp. MPI-PUGE-AT-0066]